MQDIFFSYAHEDLERIRPIVSALEGQGWSVFWDRRIPAGQTWRSYIGKALDEGKCLIVAWSKNSIISDWVIEEADEGKRRGKLVPILLDQVEPPRGFREIQAANFTDWESSKASIQFEQFLGDVRSILNDSGKAPAPAPKPSPEYGRPAVLPSPPSPARSVNKFALAAGLGTTLLVIVGLIWWLLPHPKPTPEPFPESSIDSKIAVPVTPEAHNIMNQPAPQLEVKAKTEFPRQWRVEWLGSRSKTRYTGTMSLRQKSDDNTYIGEIIIRTPQGQEVYQDAVVTINNSKVEIKCSNPSLPEYPADNFFLDLAGNTMTGYDKDVKGNIGYGVTFTAIQD